MVEGRGTCGCTGEGYFELSSSTLVLYSRSRGGRGSDEREDK